MGRWKLDPRLLITFLSFRPLRVLGFYPYLEFFFSSIT